MADKSQTRRVRLLGSVVAVALLFGTGLIGHSGTAGAMTSKPKISHFTASPHLVNTGDGTVVLSATVANAVECTLSSNLLVAGLPTAVPCSMVHHVVQLPWNPASSTPVMYVFFLAAQGSTASKTKKVKVKVAPGEGGYVFPSKITGTESGSTGTNGVTEYYPFSLTFEFDRNGPPCVATSVCAYTETTISGSGGEYDPPPGTCEQLFPIDQSGASVAGYEANIDPNVDGAEHLNFEAQTAPIDTGGNPCFNSLDWGLDHTSGDGYTSNDVWIPGATTLNVSYDDGVTSGTVDFTFSYS